MTKAGEPRGFDGPLADLYDVFVDWPGRLAKEMPWLRARLDSVGARRVLDVGCGTGKHVEALLAAGYDAVGADAEDAMLEHARRTAGADRFHRWRLGEPVPDAVAARGDFDAVVALGNVWPQLTESGASERALDALRGRLRPGGLLVLALKAFAVRLENGEPRLPLLRREHAGRPVFFVRFLDPASVVVRDGARCVDFHFAVLGDGVRDHRAETVRAWAPAELERALEDAGFVDVAVAAALGDPATPPSGEDVFVIGRRPD